jgi:hypothetical protein
MATKTKEKPKVKNLPKSSSMVLVKVGTKNTAKYWAAQINTIWRKTAISYIEMGKLLVEAKSVLKQSEWKLLLDNELDFDESKAKKLILIAQHQTLTKSSNLNLLPPSYTTLYTLTKLDDKAVSTAIKRGDIHPNMDGSDADELVQMVNPKKPKPELSREADDAEVIEHEDDEQEEDDEGEGEGADAGDGDDNDDDDAPAPKGIRKTEEAKATPYDTAVDNFDGGIDSMLYYCENLEAAMEKKGVDKLDKDLKVKLKQLHAVTARLLKTY